MFRTATAIAVAALFCAPAMAQTLTSGQYKGKIQITGVLDVDSVCQGQAGAYFDFAAGNVSTSTATVGTATVAALGAIWTESIADTNPTTASSYGTKWVNCAHSALPLASAFTSTPVGTSATEYVATPAGNATSACFASSGPQPKYTLTSTNGTGTPAQSNTVTIIPVSGADSGFKVTTVNSAVVIGSTTVCYVSTDALYLYTE